MSDAFTIHVDYESILEETAKLRSVDKNLVDKLNSFIISLKEITLRLEPVIRRESNQGEQRLWLEYTQLQQEKLIVLDLSHEYKYMEDNVQAYNPRLNAMIKETLDEIGEHISVQVETHRAHIDILEIRKARQLTSYAILVSATIAYIAVWEYSIREFLVNVDFPFGLTPGLNYAISVLTFLPVFVAIFWLSLKRRRS